jgi:hypothetical protein
MSLRNGSQVLCRACFEISVGRIGMDKTMTECVTTDSRDMKPADIKISLEKIGGEMHEFITELYPICRSATGNGVRETLGLLGQHIPLTIHEVASGTQVFDWTVPEEWNISRRAR